MGSGVSDGTIGVVVGVVGTGVFVGVGVMVGMGVCVGSITQLSVVWHLEQFPVRGCGEGGRSE